jgi:hypothetical protein
MPSMSLRCERAKVADFLDLLSRTTTRGTSRPFSAPRNLQFAGRGFCSLGQGLLPCPSGSLNSGNLPKVKLVPVGGFTNVYSGSFFPDCRVRAIC